MRESEWRAAMAGASGTDHTQAGDSAVPSPVAGTTGTVVGTQIGAGNGGVSGGSAGTTAGVPHGGAGTGGTREPMAGVGGSGSTMAGAGGTAGGPAGGAGGAPVAGTGGPIKCANGIRPEECDNQDNDCDDKVDEELVRNCGNTMGECKAGAETCAAGVWGACTGAIGPTTEVCDADMKDENCDGSANEKCACSDGQTKKCGNATSPCIQGTQTCANGVWGTTCADAKGPTTETCNGVDDDCDNTPDDGAMCASGLRCVSGQCVQCTAASECPRVACKTASCTLGQCQQSNSERHTACGSGDVCDGNGACVACTTADDCIGKVKSDTCNIATCSAAGVCSSQINSGANCGTNARCNSAGECVPNCGNGVVEANLNEECDPGAAGWSQTCSSTCKQQIYGRPCSTAADCIQPGSPYTGNMICGGGNICVPTCMVANSDSSPPDVCPAVPNRVVFCASPFCFMHCSSDAQCAAGTMCIGNACGKLSGT